MVPSFSTKEDPRVLLDLEGLMGRGICRGTTLPSVLRGAPPPFKAPHLPRTPSEVGRQTAAKTGIIKSHDWPLETPLARANSDQVNMAILKGEFKIITWLSV